MKEGFLGRVLALPCQDRDGNPEKKLVLPEKKSLAFYRRTRLPPPDSGSSKLTACLMGPVNPQAEDCRKLEKTSNRRPPSQPTCSLFSLREGKKGVGSHYT